MDQTYIEILGAAEHNLKNIDLRIQRNKITVVTGASGSGKSSLAFDTVLAEANRRFLYTLSQYSRQFLDFAAKPEFRSIRGLSPAIGLAQNETKPSTRATVGSQTDLSELLGVLFSNYGRKLCPTHQEETEAQTPEQIAEGICRRYHGQRLAVLAPMGKNKQSAFRNELSLLAGRGYLRVLLNGKFASLSPLPKLGRERKNSLSVLIDLINVSKEKSAKRILRAVQAATELTDGFGEVLILDDQEEQNPEYVVDESELQSFAISGGCRLCGFSWPKLDPRYFSPNSLGKCATCNGLGGSLGSDEGEGNSVDSQSPKEKKSTRGQEGRFLYSGVCSDCEGTGIKSEMASVRVGDQSIHQVQNLSMQELGRFLASIGEAARGMPPARRQALDTVLGEVLDRVERLTKVGFHYLHSARRIATLSSGENQRLRLAGILSENLRGVLYVLDEPSQGLHQSELDSVWQILEGLRDQGNTIIVVDHDEYLIQKADWIIDLGPGGGVQGGEVVGAFAPSDAEAHVKRSSTARMLVAVGQQSSEKPPVFRPRKTLGESETKKPELIEVVGPRLHNLKMESVGFRKGAINCVTGVSGAGKTTLVFSVLFQNLHSYVATKEKAAGKKKASRVWRYAEEIRGVENCAYVAEIDRRPIAKSTVSMPATYLDLMGDIRKLYEKLPDAQIAGLTSRDFSLASGEGRCEECKGRGEIVISMRFLPDARTRCPLCQGQRYGESVLGVRYNGISIFEVLELTLAEAAEHFKNQKRISRKLAPALDLGLGYLKLGQTSASLSGGEAQRLKLVPYLSKVWKDDSILFIDEPTRGLHYDEVVRLMKSLVRLVDDGLTVIMIEHHPTAIQASDWIIDLGPGSGEKGGNLVYQGVPPAPPSK